jgi:hypothetical protein
VSPPLLRDSSVSSQGEQPPLAPISLFIALVFARLLAEVDSHHRGTIPPCSASSGASALALCPQSCSLDCPECVRVLPLVPRALSWPFPSSPARSRREVERRRHPDHAGQWISDVHPRSSGYDLIRTNLILIVRCKSSRPDLLPSPTLCPRAHQSTPTPPSAGPNWSARLPLWSLTPVPACECSLRARACGRVRGI